MLEPVAFAAAPGEPIGVAAWRTTLEREVAPGDWLRLLAESQGEAMVGDPDRTVACDTRATILTRGDAGHGEFTAAYAALKSGAVLAVVRAATPGRADEQVAALHAIVEQSHLHGAGPWPFAERLTRLCPRHPVDFVTLYPASWELMAEMENGRDLSAIRLRNMAGAVPAGEIAVTALRDKAGITPERLLRFIAEFAGRGADAWPALVPRPVDAPGGASGAWHAQGQAGRAGTRLEFEVRVYRSETGWLVLSHWRLAREHHRATWAVNRRAMELVARYLRFRAPGPDDADYAPLLSACASP